MSHKTHNGRSYDVSVPEIQCGADKVGAEIFTVQFLGQHPWKVLAYSEKDAEDHLREYLRSGSDD